MNRYRIEAAARTYCSAQWWNEDSEVFFIKARDTKHALMKANKLLEKLHPYHDEYYCEIKEETP